MGENSLIKAFRMQCAASIFNEYNLKSSTVHFYCGKLRKYEKIGILDRVITKFLVCFLYVYEIDIDTYTYMKYIYILICILYNEICTIYTYTHFNKKQIYAIYTICSLFSSK